jgi:hypothetical protein
LRDQLELRLHLFREVLNGEGYCDSLCLRHLLKQNRELLETQTGWKREDLGVIQTGPLPSADPCIQAHPGEMRYWESCLRSARERGDTATMVHLLEKVASPMHSPLQQLRRSALLVRLETMRGNREKALERLENLLVQRTEILEEFANLAELEAILVNHRNEARVNMEVARAELNAQMVQQIPWHRVSQRWEKVHSQIGGDPALLQQWSLLRETYRLSTQQSLAKELKLLDQLKKRAATRDDAKLLLEQLAQKYQSDFPEHTLIALAAELDVKHLVQEESVKRVAMEDSLYNRAEQSYKSGAYWDAREYLLEVSSPHLQEKRDALWGRVADAYCGQKRKQAADWFVRSAREPQDVRRNHLEQSIHLLQSCLTAFPANSFRTTVEANITSLQRELDRIQNTR